MVVITKVSRKKKGSAGQNLSGRARAIFTRAVNLRGFPPGVPTGVGKNFRGVCRQGERIARKVVRSWKWICLASSNGWPN